MPSLRIAYFAEKFPSTSETWVHNEILELIKNGCDVKVFATHALPESIALELQTFVDITIYRNDIKKSLIKSLGIFFNPIILKKLYLNILTDCKDIRHKLQVIRDIFYIGTMSDLIKDFKPDFLISHFGGTRANMSLIFSLIYHIPFAIKFHAGDVFNRVALFRLKTKYAKKLLTISKYNIDYIGQHNSDIEISKFIVHKCGIPVDKYIFSPKPLLRGIPKIISVGRLVRMKGFRTLIYASKILIDKGLLHSILIYGEGPENEILKRLINEMSLCDVVRLMGYIAPTDVRAALLDSDIFVMPSEFDAVSRTMDGIPVALMEAMAIGVPVVSTSISGIPELVEYGLGHLASPADAESLAQALTESILMQSVDRMQMLRLSRAKIEKEHDVEKLTSLLLSDIYEITGVNHNILAS